LIKLYWRGIFDLFAYFHYEQNIVFLNTGYADLKEGSVFLDELSSHPMIFHMQLYHFLIGTLGYIKGMSRKTLLETGCGKGGGANYIKNTFRPQNIIGVDYSGRNVQYIYSLNNILYR
jgi:hypothetical protein